jgi:intracellular sulfur oxidation DsrE/DsrF family protein
VEQLLTLKEAPPGVAFEIVESGDDDLSWALPLVTAHSERLRARFPGLPIAVVTHGSEQFGLLSNQIEEPYDQIHADAKGLRADNIDLHICGAHAGWYGNTAADFPDYVDVADSGPAQLRDYENFGYQVILLRGDED